MSDLFWLSDAQIARLEPFFPIRLRNGRHSRRYEGIGGVARRRATAFCSAREHADIVLINNATQHQHIITGGHLTAWHKITTEIQP